MKQEEKTGGFSSLGEFLVKVRKACDGVRDNSAGSPDSRLTKTAGHMETGEDSQGGYLVPEQWAQEIYHAALEDSIVRSRATVLRATSDSLKVRVLKDSDRSSNYFGGITFTWTAETGSKVAAISKPALAEVELTPHKLVGSCFVSNELEDDYGAFGDFMAKSFGQAIRFEEDDMFLNGTGAGQPLGIMNGGLMISVTRNANSKVDWPDFANMAKRLLPDSWKRAVWLINPDVMDELLESTASAANQVPMFNASEMTILSLPIIVTEKCEAMGTTGDVILADFGAGHYLIADREMRISASRHVKYGQGNYGFITDETFWKVVLRVDGQPLLSADITPKRGANDLGPFVCLTTAS